MIGRPWFGFAIRPRSRPLAHTDAERALFARIRSALDLLFSEQISPGDPARFEMIRRALLVNGDHYMHLADLRSYAETHAKLGALHRDDPSGWIRKAILNVAGGGKFSSDRTIREYAREIWDAKSCPIP